MADENLESQIMSVDTRHIADRRKVRYQTFDDLLDDARTLASGEVRSLGNWSLGQTLAHLGAAMEASIDGRPFPVPWWLKLLGKVYLKRRLVDGPFPPGFQLPRAAREKLVFDEKSPAEGMAVLEHGIERLQRETSRTAHPVAGPLSLDEWNRFHLSHAEMHMSFLLPVTEDAVDPDKTA